jgi:hypothetical protein
MRRLNRSRPKDTAGNSFVLEIDPEGCPKVRVKAPSANCDRTLKADHRFARAKDKLNSRNQVDGQS